jgi:uncharacterized protein
VKNFSVSLIISCFFIFSCKSQKNQIWILDNEHLLTAGQIAKLDSLYNAHEKKTTNEIALITTHDYGEDSSILIFALHFLRNYGIGKKDKNNGVAIVFSAKLRETFIATGYGTEKVLKDEIVKYIIDSLMIPRFKEGNYFEGIWEGSLAITEFLDKPANKIN